MVNGNQAPFEAARRATAASMVEVADEEKLEPMELPRHGRFLELNGLKYHYLDQGRGDAVVMLHGNPTWSFYYRDLARALPDGYRAIIPDHMGCGMSEKPGDNRYDYRLRSRVDDLERLLEHLQLRERLTLVLHDWGGMIGMAYASRYPERIKRLVILNTAAFLLPKNKRFPLALRVARMPLLGDWLLRATNLFCRGTLRFGLRTRRLSPHIQRSYLEPYDSYANRIAVARFVQDIPLKPRHPSYALVDQVQRGLHRFARTPTLICWGCRDFVFSSEFLDQWVRHLPHAEVHRFEDAGHLVLEDARFELIPRVVHFLEANPI